MKNTTPYKKQVHWLFGDGEWAITSYSETQIFISETRKNGQEDCHMSEVLCKVDGRWKIVEQEEADSFDPDPNWISSVADYCGEEEVKRIEDHINKHGLPTDV